MTPAVLDACCGPRAFWFNREDARALYVDIREETHEVDVGTPGTKGRKPMVIKPDIVASFTDLPFPDNTFYHVVFDPPHMQRLEARGKMTRHYGILLPGWREVLQDGFAECFRVLRPGGTLIFKWCETEISLAEVLALTPEKPLYGHRSGKKAQTIWVAFIKAVAPGAAT